MQKLEILRYYSREDVIRNIIENAKNREIAGAFWDGTYDQRPNIIQFPSDVTQMVKKGVTSFHLSVEHWNNPMQLGKEMSKSDYDKIRTGWDLLIDIDSKIGIPGAQIAAVLTVDFLKKYGIKNIGIKFSGSRGFHIIVPWKAFPKEINYKQLSNEYPDAPRIIAEFISSRISDNLMDELIKLKGAKELIDILDEQPEELDPFYFVELEKGWGNRHMFRAPYSLNEKTWLVSVPLSEKQLLDFDVAMANPNNIRFEEPFFRESEQGEASNLVMEAFDWNAKYAKKEESRIQRKVRYTGKVQENMFPPCVNNILKGIPDGRKRSVFTLINFLKMMNWSEQEIGKKVIEWNEKNQGPLPRAVITSQLRYHQRRRILPANCNGDGRNSTFYGFVCQPDDVCKRIKNPVTYPFRRMGPKQRLSYQKPVYKCDICNKGFSSMRGVMLHKVRAHQ